MNKSVLFVDDEPNLLNGLKRLTRSLRHEWDMQFALGGKEALEMMSKTCFDVVVTDMKMPEIDGAKLLEQVREECPFSVRMILSGQAAESAILRSIRYSHQYLSKPCTPERLETKIKKACATRELLDQYKIKEIVSKLDFLLTLPFSVAHLKSLLQTEEPDINGIADIIARDIGLSAKVLQLTNSDYFGAGSSITNIYEAVRRLGVGKIKLLIENTGVLKANDLIVPGLHFAQMTAHSYRVAKTAKQIAKIENLSKEEQEQVFTAGMLHEIGRLILVTELPQEYKKVAELIEVEKISHIEAEREIFGSSHAEVGAYLLALWGIADPIIEAVACQAEPTKSLENSRILGILHAANALEDELRPTRTDETKIQFDEEYLRMLDLWGEIEKWRDARLKGECNG